MITIILLILIGIKLNMMNGLYLALIIISIVLWIIDLFLRVLKLIKGYLDWEVNYERKRKRN